jgi:deoxyribodipyrimidine photolyase-related protein
MREAVIVYPNQLFKKNSLIKKDRDIYIVEDPVFYTKLEFHFNKLVLHRASMKFYESYLKKKGHHVFYIEKMSKTSDIKNELKKYYEKIHLFDPVDTNISRILKEQFGSKLITHETPMFICTNDYLNKYTKNKKSFLMENFYREQRKRLDMLVDKDDKPQGGKWNFDKENRKKLPKQINIPKIYIPKENEFVKEAKQYIKKNFKYVGEEDSFIYPTTFNESEKALNNFLKHRLESFGNYEDAISKDQNVIFHSILTPYLNIGLITPNEVLDKTLDYADKNNIPLNSLEGFVRQIIGWREFMRMMYVKKGDEMKKKNYFNFSKKITKEFWNGNTNIKPLDNTIDKVRKSGYCHHIERLMILSNYMLLSEFDPDQVYKWFMQFFIDSYDWVMVPNVYGMGQYADGGIFATKPYISGSNYILKMSDYKKGDWSETWNNMYWDFLDNNKDKFVDNPRMSLMLNLLEKRNKKN